MEHNPNHKGNVAELAIAKEAADLGLTVLKPLTEHERYDLVLGMPASYCAIWIAAICCRSIWWPDVSHSACV